MTTDVWGRAAATPTRVVQPERRGRQLSGLPPRFVPGDSIWMRLVRSPWTWLVPALVVVYVLCIWRVWSMLSADNTLEDGSVIPGFDWATVKTCARFAAPTAAVWSAFFILFDRIRPNRILLWLLAFGWGSCLAIYTSLVANSWVADLLSVSAGAGDPAAASRPAVFAAPFVEEASKATILFLLAVLVRHRIVTMMQAICLAGLSAVGFAFTENIVYYARAMIYGSLTIGTGDVEEQVKQLVYLRGFLTSFGHPTFTMFIGIGIVVGLRHRSKVVRILAPLTGFFAAAFGHMLFNGMSSVGALTGTGQFKWILAIIVIAMTMVLFRNHRKELRRVKDRLTDFVRMGWLPPRDPVVMSSWRKRSWLLLVAFFRGPRTWWRTWRLVDSLTELAYVRDSMVRGLVDEAGLDREKELLHRVRGLRSRGALHETDGLRLTLDLEPLKFWRGRSLAFKRPRPAPQQWAPPTASEPVSVPAGAWPPPSGR